MSMEEKNIEQINDENIEESPTETENPTEVSQNIDFPSFICGQWD